MQNQNQTGIIWNEKLISQIVELAKIDAQIAALKRILDEVAIVKTKYDQLHASMGIDSPKVEDPEAERKAEQHYMRLAERAAERSPEDFDF